MSLPTTRRVVRIDHFGPPAVLVERTEAMPAPADGQVLVAVDGVGVNFADTMIRRGEYRRAQVLPHIPGMEAAGTVVAAPPGGRLAAGTRVALFLEHGGGYADHVLAPESLTYPVPAGIPGPLVAGTFLQGVTAWYAVHRYGLVRAGDTVLVTGAAGGLGGLTVQLSREAGATVIGVASSSAKREHVLSLGCDLAVDPRSENLADELRSVAPRGIDVIVDGVGGDLFMPLLRALAKSGRYVVVGSATQRPAMIDVRHLLPRGQTIVGFVVRNVMDLDEREPATALSAVLERVMDGRLKPRIEVMPLGAAAHAHELLESRSVMGKIVLDPST